MYSKIKAASLAKPSRKSVSRFEKTPEWKLMKADIDRGLKVGEALQLAFNAEDKKKYKIKNRVTVARFIKKYLSAHELSYRVRTFRRDDREYVIVVNLPEATREETRVRSA